MPTATSAPVFEAIAPDSAGMPLYRAVKRSLLDAIEAGTCAPGKTLPSETEIAGAMGVSIGTLRRAVDELTAERILVRRQGRGTYVATHNSDRFLFQFFRVEREDGLRDAPQVDLLSFERLRAEAEPARALALQPGEPVFQIENRLHLQNQPVIYDRLTLPASLFKGLTEKRVRENTGTLYQLFQADFGISVLRAKERARVGVADRHAARVLGLAPGAPVMQLRRTALSFVNLL
jgi:GntR family transcriptional regulator